jgi:hypothetical protein
MSSTYSSVGWPSIMCCSDRPTTCSIGGDMLWVLSSHATHKFDTFYAASFEFIIIVCRACKSRHSHSCILPDNYSIKWHISRHIFCRLPSSVTLFYSSLTSLLNIFHIVWISSVPHAFLSTINSYTLLLHGSLSNNCWLNCLAIIASSESLVLRLNRSRIRTRQSHSCSSTTILKQRLRVILMSCSSITLLLIWEMSKMYLHTHTSSNTEIGRLGK